jgi:hypothetical protein
MKYRVFDHLFNLLKDIVEIVDLKSRPAPREEPDNREGRISQLSINIIKNLFDALISYSFLHPGTLSEGKMGLIGTVTSLIGVYQLWE